jgi:pimeloyl-ACP methyl ester carboxylesterase
VREHRLELADGRSLRVLEAGAGPPLVLIHGALATADDMALGPMPALARSHRVLAVDRPGHGLSGRARFEAAPQRQAELIRDGLAELGVERPLVFGHSAGGWVALAWAAAWPDSVAGLILVGPIVYPELRPMEHLLLAPRAAPLGGPVLSEAATDTVDPAMLEALQKAMFAPQPVPEHWKRGFPDELVLDAMVANGEDAMALLSPFALIDLSRIAAPAEILYGTLDRVVDPRRHAIPLSAQLRSARLTRLPGLGHMAHHFAAEEIAAAVARLGDTIRIRNGDA